VGLCCKLGAVLQNWVYIIGFHTRLQAPCVYDIYTPYAHAVSHRGGGVLAIALGSHLPADEGKPMSVGDLRKGETNTIHTAYAVLYM
jgi:hypothetical protein